MKSKRNLLIFLLVAVFALSALSGCGKKEEKPAEQSSSVAEQTSSVQESVAAADQTYENAGLKLTVPAKYSELVTVETPANDKDGVLFAVSETASVEAGKKSGNEGAGWLFSIVKVDEKTMNELMKNDLGGREVIAKDGAGDYFLFTHPTDVRLEREDADAMNAAMPQWEELNTWAASVKSSFISENGGLASAAYTPEESKAEESKKEESSKAEESKKEESSKTEESKKEESSKTEESKKEESSKAEESKAESSKTEESKTEESKAETAEAQIDDPEYETLFGNLATKVQTNHYLTSLEYGQLDGTWVDPEIYASSLTDLKSLKEVDMSQIPDGEQLIVVFPDSGLEYHFFSMDGSGNYIYKIDDHQIENLYVAEFNDDSYTAYEIVEKWYSDLHNASEDAGLANQDAFIGEWADTVSGRGTVSISLGPDDDSLQAFVMWSDSAAERHTWSMTMTPVGNGQYYYSNAICELHAFDESGNETVTEVYNDGTGFMWINGDGELEWTDEIEHVAEFTTFAKQ